jgi:hypothetical protein
MLRTTDSFSILIMYVDDLLITDNSILVISSVKGILHDMFSMTYMGPLHLFIVLKIIQDASGIKLSQDKYARYLMERFHMKDYKSGPTPFLSGVRLEDGLDTPVVDNILYIKLVWRLMYLTHT